MKTENGNTAVRGGEEGEEMRALLQNREWTVMRTKRVLWFFSSFLKFLFDC